MNSISTDLNKMANQEKRPSLLINSLSNWTNLAVTLIVGFLLTPFIISHLGKTGYGIWTLIASIIGYYGILDLGVTSAITRYVARYAGQKNFKALKVTINTAMAIFIVIALAVIGLSFALAGPLAEFFNIQPDYINEFRQVVWILGVTAGLGFPGYLLGAVIRAHEKFVVANSVIILATLIRAGLIVLFLSKGFGLMGIAWSHLVCAVVIVVSNYALCKILFPHFQTQIKGVKWSMVRLLVGFGVATTVASIADIMRFNLDSFVVGKWVNIPAVAVYGVAALLVRFFLQFISSGTQAIYTPRYASLDGEGKRDQLKQLFLKSLSVSAFLSFAAGALIIIFCKQFIILWVGTDFLDSVPILWVLTVSYSIALAQSPGISLVYALKKHYLFAGASIIEGIANVALSIYLAPRYGILGVAMGTVVPMLIIKLFVQPIYVSRIIGISFFRYWRQLLPPLGLAIAVIMIERYIPPINFLSNGYISLAVCALPYLSTFIIFYLVIEVIIRKRCV